jgi:hypothetical protein
MEWPKAPLNIFLPVAVRATRCQSVTGHEDLTSRIRRRAGGKPRARGARRISARPVRAFARRSGTKRSSRFSRSPAGRRQSARRERVARRLLRAHRLSHLPQPCGSQARACPMRFPAGQSAARSVIRDCRKRSDASPYPSPGPRLRFPISWARLPRGRLGESLNASARFRLLSPPDACCRVR